MNYDEIYQAVRDYMDANGTTLQQLASVTPKQAISFLGLTGDDVGRLNRGWDALRSRVKRELRSEAEAQELADLKDFAKAWVWDKWPDAQFQRNGREITIYLDGGQE